VAGVTSNGELFHTIRFGSTGNWQNFGNVRQAAGNNQNRFVDVDICEIVDNLFLCAVTNEGNILYTIRYPGRWDPFAQIQENNQALYFLAVSTAQVNGNVHVCGISGGGNLYHNTRAQYQGRWNGFALINNQIDFKDIDCGNVERQLHLGAVTLFGDLLHTIRFPYSWQNFGDIERQSGERGFFKHIGICSYKGS
jgi:hypothetical protein